MSEKIKNVTVETSSTFESPDTYENDSVLDMGERVLNYYADFKNQSVKLNHLYEPIGDYSFYNDKPSGTIKRKLKQRLGLDISVQTRDGGFMEVFVKCTDKLWDEILSDKIYRIIEDEIFLSFDKNGVAFKYSLKPTKETSEVVDNVPNSELPNRFIRAKDVHNTENQQFQGNSGFNSKFLVLAKESNGDSVKLSVKLVPSYMNAHEANVVVKATAKHLSDTGELKVMDIIKDDYVIADLRGDNSKYIYIAKL